MWWKVCGGMCGTSADVNVAEQSNEQQICIHSSTYKEGGVVWTRNRLLLQLFPLDFGAITKRTSVL